MSADQRVTARMTVPQWSQLFWSGYGLASNHSAAVIRLRLAIVDIHQRFTNPLRHRRSNTITAHLVAGRV